MGRATLLVCVALLVGGCGPYGKLKDTVEALAPDGARTIGKCQEFGAYVIDTPGYGCAYFVPGARRAVARSLAKRLAELGFRAVCEEDSLSGTIDFRAWRGETAVTAKVSRLRSVISMSGNQPLNIYDDVRFLSDYRAAPPGHVIVKLLASAEDRPVGGGTRHCRGYAGIRA
jgi:hypothetical protein